MNDTTKQTPRERLRAAFDAWTALADPDEDHERGACADLAKAIRAVLAEPQPDPDAELREWAHGMIQCACTNELLATPPAADPRPVDVVKDGEVFSLAEEPTRHEQRTRAEKAEAALASHKCADHSANLDRALAMLRDSEATNRTLARLLTEERQR